MLTAKVKIASVMLLGFGLVTGGGAALSGRREVALADGPSAAVPGRDHSGRDLSDRSSVRQAEKDWQTAEFYRRTGHLGSARYYYELICRRYPETLYAEQAGERLRELWQNSKLAVVNGVPISSADVYAAAYLADPDLCTLGVFARALRVAGDWKKMLDQLIEREVVVQTVRARLTQSNPKFISRLEQAASKQFDRSWVRAARTKMRLEDDDGLDAALQAQGTSLAAVRRQWERAFLVQEYLRSRVAAGSQAGARPEEMKRIVDDLKRRAVIEYGAEH